MATISYTVSATVGGATAKCTLTATYSITQANDRTTVTASKLVTSSISSSGAAAYRGDAIDSLRSRLNNVTFALTFDGQTVATRTGVTAGTTYTSYTGSKYVTKTHSAQTKTLQFVNSNSKVSVSVPAKPSYSVTYNANSGSGAPAAQTKWYNEALTISTTKPTKSGYTFLGWATSTDKAANGYSSSEDYASGGTYSANAAVTLYAIWELTYSKPTITSVSIERCIADGTEDDEGTYAKITFDWSVFTSSSSRYYGGTGSPYSSNRPTGCSVTVNTTDTVSVAFDPDATSGTASVVVGSGSYDTDTEYPVSIVLSDTQTTKTSNTTTVTGILSKSAFPMDFNADATAVGFFCPAPDDGDGIYCAAPMTLKHSASQTGLANGTYYFAQRTDTGVAVGLGVGSGGTNHGVWSIPLDNWLIYSNGTNVYVNGTQFPMTVTSPSVSVSTTTGTLKSMYARQYGKVVELIITCNNSATTASGANIFTGTLNTTALRPLLYTTGGSYYGAHAITGSINSAGAIFIRNASSTSVSITGSNTATVSFTYIVA